MSNKRLVLSVIEFLNQSIKDGTVAEDSQESLEVAVQCIGEAFGVDPTDQKQTEQLSVKPATLPTIFDVFLKTKDKISSNAATSSSEPAASTSSSSTTPSVEDKAAADKMKQAGNAQMSSKKYDEAIASYTEAIRLDSQNPVYYSNRAAAHSSKGDHLSAVGDAELAIAVSPTFVKAYHRLGHAQYSLGDFKAAASAFERGLALDPTNTSLKSGLQNAQARVVDDDEDGPPELIPDTRGAPAGGAGGVPDMGAMANMMRNMGGGGGGGGGGMPDMASMMNNPAMMAAAQQMMAGGGLENLMQNPAIANLMSRVQSGGGLPDMSELMADPNIRELASKFGAGAQR